MIINRVGIILNHVESGRFLCVFQNESNLWGFPKGRLNKDETFKEGACRELYEETNIKLDPSDIDINNMIHIRRGNHNHFYFIKNVTEFPNVKIDMNEIIDYRWLNKQELKKNFYKKSFFTTQCLNILLKR